MMARTRMLVSRSGPKKKDPSGVVAGHALVVGWLMLMLILMLMQCKWLDVKGGKTTKHQMLD